MIRDRQFLHSSIHARVGRDGTGRAAPPAPLASQWHTVPSLPFPESLLQRPLPRLKERPGAD